MLSRAFSLFRKKLRAAYFQALAAVDVLDPRQKVRTLATRHFGRRQQPSDYPLTPRNFDFFPGLKQIFNYWKPVAKVAQCGSLHVIYFSIT